jgi:hypothetical protein
MAARLPDPVDPVKQRRSLAEAVCYGDVVARCTDYERRVWFSGATGAGIELLAPAGTSNEQVMKLLLEGYRAPVMLPDPEGIGLFGRDGKRVAEVSLSPGPGSKRSVGLLDRMRAVVREHEVATGGRPQNSLVWVCGRAARHWMDIDSLEGSAILPLPFYLVERDGRLDDYFEGILIKITDGPINWPTDEMRDTI